MIAVAAGLGQYVDLCRLMAELRRINARLDLELLDSIDGREYDIGFEIGIRVRDTVKGVVVKHNPVSADGDGLTGPVSALTSGRLSRSGRESVGVGGQGHQSQVIAPVQGKFGNLFVFDDSSQGNVFGLQHLR